MKNTIIKLLLLTLFFVGSAPVFSQVGIGTTTPDASAILDITATNKGVLLTRVATTSAIASPVNGLIIYDISEKCVKTYQNNAWSNCLATGLLPEIETLECSNATTVGTLTAGTTASGVSFTVNYTGGNQGVYTGEIIASTGVTGLTAVSVGGTLANGSGSVTYTVTGTPTGIAAGTASFAITIGGQSCTVNLDVLETEPVITGLDCDGATIVGTLVGSEVASGVSFTVNYTGGNGVAYIEQTVNSTGVTGLTATLVAGTLAAGSGSLTYNVSGTPEGIPAGTASFAITMGGMLCTVNLDVLEGAPVVTALECSTATLVGTLQSGTAANGATFTVNYTEGNGASYTGEIVNSTGVTGLTAILAAGNLVTGDGALTYTIVGTPTAAGTVSFAISIGGQACTLTATVIDKEGEVTTSCGVWMDRNLGAENVGDDGDYYQWGRTTDGHQLRTASAYQGPVAAGSEGSKFIKSTLLAAGDWLVSRDDLRWNSGTEANPIKAVHDPCPSGYRVPTGIELMCLKDNYSYNYLVSGSLNMPLAGYRIGIDNIFTPNKGLYWSSSVLDITYGERLYANNGAIAVDRSSRSYGASIRCIKE